MTTTTLRPHARDRGAPRARGTPGTKGTPGARVALRLTGDDARHVGAVARGLAERKVFVSVSDVLRHALAVAAGVCAGEARRSPEGARG